MMIHFFFFLPLPFPLATNCLPKRCYTLRSGGFG